MQALALRRKHLKSRQRSALNFYLYISPWLIGFAVFTIVPMAASLFYSFRNVSFIDLDSNGTFIGWNNYIAAFKDSLFTSSIGNTFYYAFAKTFIAIFFALLLALLLNSKFHANKAVRILVYLPAILPAVASILVWSQLFSKDFSLLNYFLSFFSIHEIDWTSYSNAMNSVLLMSVWNSIGPYMLMILAALQDLPVELLEAADVEGAGPFRKFFSIIIPLISPTLFFISITGVIGGLQAYAEMQLLFGQATDHTMTMAWNVVINAFSLDGTKTMGYACAQAWILFLIIVAFTFLYFKASGKFVYYGGGDDK